MCTHTRVYTYVYTYMCVLTHTYTLFWLQISILVELCKGSVVWPSHMAGDRVTRRVFELLKL